MKNILFLLVLICLSPYTLGISLEVFFDVNILDANTSDTNQDFDFFVPFVKESDSGTILWALNTDLSLLAEESFLSTEYAGIIFVWNFESNKLFKLDEDRPADNIWPLLVTTQSVSLSVDVKQPDSNAGIFSLRVVPKEGFVRDISLIDERNNIIVLGNGDKIFVLYDPDQLGSAEVSLFFDERTFKLKTNNRNFPSKDELMERFLWDLPSQDSCIDYMTAEKSEKYCGRTFEFCASTFFEEPFNCTIEEIYSCNLTQCWSEGLDEGRFTIATLEDELVKAQGQAEPVLAGLLESLISEVQILKQSEDERSSTTISLISFGNTWIPIGLSVLALICVGAFLFWRYYNESRQKHAKQANFSRWIPFEQFKKPIGGEKDERIDSGKERASGTEEGKFSGQDSKSNKEESERFSERKKFRWKL